IVLGEVRDHGLAGAEVDRQAIDCDSLFYDGVARNRDWRAGIVGAVAGYVDGPTARTVTALLEQAGGEHEGAGNRSAPQPLQRRTLKTIRKGVGARAAVDNRPWRHDDLNVGVRPFDECHRDAAERTLPDRLDEFRTTKGLDISPTRNHCFVVVHRT